MPWLPTGDPPPRRRLCGPGLLPQPPHRLARMNGARREAAFGIGRRHRSRAQTLQGGRTPTAREGERADDSTLQRASRTSEPSPAPEPRPASRTGPTGPILRANPYPEVTDLICRLPLPTLVYRPEASYLGDRLRIWVRTGPKLGYIAEAACVPAPPPKQRAAPADPLTFTPCSYLPRMFHGPAVVRGTPQEPRRSTADRVTSTLSLCEWLLGSRRLKQKRKLFPGPPPMDASWFPLPGSCTQGQQPKKELVPGLASRPGYGISTVFPFATNSQPAT